MNSVPQTPTTSKHHRRAYGSHRKMSPQYKADCVAASIQAREQAGVSWSWASYGIESNVAQQALVLAALARQAA